MRPYIEERFCAKVRAGEGCWEWAGARIKPSASAANGHGYGQFYANRKVVAAHRFAYEMFVGPIPHGLTLDHLCRNRGCVNPAHLEPVTSRINTLRGEGITARYARQTHCKHGHALTPDNTAVSPRRGRECRACIAATWKRYRAKQRAERAA